MKRFIRPNILPVFTLLTGGLGLGLRVWQLAAGMDENGLIIAGHPSSYLMLGLTVLTLLVLFFSARSVDTGVGYAKRFPRSVLAAAGNYAAAAGILIFSLVRLTGSMDWLTILQSALGIAAAACLVFLGYCRRKPTRPAFLFHAFITVYLMVFVLLHYSTWSASPQLGRYCFEAFAAISLMLAAYYRAALDARQKCWQMYSFFNQCVLFFCCLSLTGPNRLFYLAMLIWAAANLPSMRIRKQPARAKPAVMSLPESALFCIQSLEKAGFEAYAVGGCVRDSLLGLTPHDYDLCTSATPEEICRVFSEQRLVRSGEKHGTIGILLEDGVYEITTFRTEGAYTDNRHPDWVAFVSRLEDDLQRRDFTVNAMAYSPSKGYIDPYGGRQDLQQHILRTVGDPEARFREDALRILRGARFSVRYQLTPEEGTEKAMQQLAPLMDNLARERVFEELCKLLPLASAEDLVRYAPILTQVIPELAPSLDFDQHSPHHKYDVYTHTAHVVEAVPRELTLRWAALLHDIGKPAVFTQDADGRGHFRGHAAASAEQADAILRRLKAPNALREQVVFLVAFHMTPLEPERKLLLRWLGKYGKESLDQLLTLQKADFCGKGTDEQTDIFTQTKELLATLTEEQACISAKDLTVNGRDILALGIEPGPLVGQCMRFLLAQVQEDAIENTKEALLEAASSYLEAVSAEPEALAESEDEEDTP